jgi:hypothetical protein
VLWIYACLFITCLRSHFTLFTYLTVVITEIGHNIVCMHLWPNRDRLPSCLRHSFGSIVFPFYKFPNAFNSLENSFYIAMRHLVWLLSRKYGTVWYHPASSKLWYLTTLPFVNFQEKLTGTSPLLSARVKPACSACCVFGARCTFCVNNSKTDRIQNVYKISQSIWRNSKCVQSISEYIAYFFSEHQCLH